MILPEKIRKKINQLERGMVQDRQSYDPKWEELRDYLCPRRGRNLGGSSNSNENYEGGEKGKKIYDTTQLRALNISAAGMQAGINSPARPWFRLKVGDTELSSNHNVAEWLAKVEEVMRGCTTPQDFIAFFTTIITSFYHLEPLVQAYRLAIKV